MLDARRLRKRFKKHRKRIKALEAHVEEINGHRKRLADDLGAFEARLIKLEAKGK